MDFDTQTLENVKRELSASMTSLSDVYAGLDWSDEVYESFEQFVDDMDRSVKGINEALQQVEGVVANLSDIRVDDLEAEFAAICG